MSPLRLGVESESTQAVRWQLRRNCSITPSQLLGFYLCIAVLSLGIALAFWRQGATLVLPFAGLEIVSLGMALLLYARHASDREEICLDARRLRVVRWSGRHIERVDFAPAWVRVEPEHGQRSLIELSGQGARIDVGRHLRPDLRLQLAGELRHALRRWRWSATPDLGSARGPVRVSPDNSEPTSSKHR